MRTALSLLPRRVLAGAIIVSCCALLAHATTATIGGANDAKIGTDVFDTTIFQSNSGNSLGGGPGMFAGTDGNNNVLRGLIKFDITDNVPAGATIQYVELRLSLGRVAGSGGGGGPGAGVPSATIDLHAVQSAWSEGTAGLGAAGIGGTGMGFPASAGDATWTASSYPGVLWNTPGGDYHAALSSSQTVGTLVNGTSSWGSTPTFVADVQGWLNDPQSNFGWELVNTDETDSRTFRAFWTKEASDPTLRPELLVTYATLPGDANHDHVVNGLDIAAVASNWLRNGLDMPADANGDRVVNGLDIALVASHWLSHEDSAAAVPEPSSGALAGLAAIACLAILGGSPRHRILYRPTLEKVRA